MTDHTGVPPLGGTPVPPPDPTPSGESAVPGAPGRAAEGAEAPAQAAEAGRLAQAAESARLAQAGRTEGRTPPAPSAPRVVEESYDTGRLQQLPTGQLLLVHRPGMPDLTPVHDDDEEVAQRRVYSWIGAIVGPVGALASLFVGWMLPLSIAAIVFGVLGLRREEHGRTLAFVAIGTGITGLVFSAVWLGYYAIVYGALPA